MAIPLTRYPSPLRYPGGKGKIANYLKLVLLRNGLTGSEYVEPYAGGASVALSLLYEEFVSHIHINDVDPSVAAFWKVVLEDAGDLCRRIERTPVTLNEWKRQKGVQAAGLGGDIDEVDLAFATFFLNRTSRSGILSGGPIGGQAQSGKWKLDARYSVDELVRRIRKVARFRSRISVSGTDAKDFLRPWISESHAAFVYLDPPYFTTGRDLYTNFYSAADHLEISRLVGKLRCPWIVSYDAVAEIHALYSKYRSVGYSLSYSVADRYRGTEVMFFSPGLAIPDVSSPANLSEEMVKREKIRAV